MLKMSDLKNRREDRGVPTPKSPLISMHDLDRKRREAFDEMARTPKETLIKMGMAKPELPDIVQGEVRADNYLYNVMEDGDWKGRRCFIIGGGSSLKNFNWDLLNGELTIGVNRAFEKHIPNIILSMDSRVWSWIEEGKFGEDAKNRFKNFKGIKVWVSQHALYPEDIYVVKQDYTPFAKVGSVRGLRTGYNSGYCALNLAAALGANPIYLLGFDMIGTGKGGQKWWHDGYPVKQTEEVYETFIKEFRRFAPVLKKSGIRVVNLYKKSALDCFEFDTIKHVLSEPRKQLPLVVSFFTPGTGQEKEADRLMFSCNRFGVEYDIGSRQTPVDKEQFVAMMKQAHPGREVVWVNPDDVFTKYPDGTIEDAVERLGPIGGRVTLITPTGDRPLAFSLCQRWMARQTRQPDQWIVVDDGKVPMTYVPAGVKYIRREPKPTDPRYTLNANLQEAIPYITGDKILIIEDDEYYAPDYVRTMSNKLDTSEVAGIMMALYYHLPTNGYSQLANTCHASLAETGFRRTFLPELTELVKDSGETYLDIRLWKRAMELKKATCLFQDDADTLFVGIKGLPGRKGIGMGHDKRTYGSFDKTKNIIRKLIPRDYDVYLDVMTGKLNEDNYTEYFQYVTGITVCQNTKELLDTAYHSVRKFHPDMPIIIVDGSDATDPCAEFAKSLASDKTTVIQPGYNIGHGRGMCLAIDNAKTPYALIFDSDIEMLKSPVKAMLAMMEPDTFAIGCIEKTGFDGFEYGANARHKNEGWMPMVHPFFHIINIANYHKYHPYVHHGAPCYLTALDIYRQGLSDKVLKVFPGIGHTAGKGWNWTAKPSEWVQHDTAGTRNIRRLKGQGETEAGWVTEEGGV
jgi:hypothetical protein